MIETKERPILMSAPMVRSILDGRKTQTRRAVKLPGSGGRGPLYQLTCDENDLWADSHCEPFKCPYGRPGDRLWVRETWAPCSTFDPSEETGAIHRAGPWRNGNEPDVKWKPSIHMPRWASRITLKIADIRVERLQDISNADAMAEGMPSIINPEYCEALHTSDMLYSHRAGFVDFLNQHGHMCWDANPWVWVISFEVVND